MNGIPIAFLQIADFLAASACETLRCELSRAGGDPATVFFRDRGGQIEPTLRKTTRVAMPAAASEQITALFLARKAEIERHFGVDLAECEEPQFLRYQPGDFFIAHQDGNSAIIPGDSRFRRISVVLFVNAQSEGEAAGTYGGGAFVFHGRHPERYPLAPEPGTLLCFRAETMHEVMPVTRGERFTVASWFR